MLQVLYRFVFVVYFLLEAEALVATRILATNARPLLSRPSNLALQESNKNNKNGSKNSDNQFGLAVGGFFQDLKDMAASVDDVVDDFFNKRMGNGEVFYGKRKYKPSGSVEGDYNGMGLTDKLRIDVARARKEAFLEERERRRVEAENRRSS